MRPLQFTGLTVRNLRILRKVDLAPSSGINIIAGANGQGKTTLLEALYLVATSRSFRTHKLKEAIAHQSEAFFLRASLSEDDQTHSRSIAVSSSERLLRIDEDRPPNVASFAVKAPVVVFHPGEVVLSSGPAQARRTLLDRVALFLNVESYLHVQAYQRALKARNRLLLSGGTNAALEVYEELLAEHGALLTLARQQAAQSLLEATQQALKTLGPPGLSFQATYKAGGCTDRAEMLQQLRSRRSRDAHRSSPSFGPHLDDLVLEIDGRLARLVASQGQHRLLTLGLKIGERACIASHLKVSPVLLFDDVSSELDAQRTDALFAFFAQHCGQVFVTTTRPELLIQLRSERAETKLFEMVAGEAISPAPG